MLCTFINPKMAQDVFKEREQSISDGFLDDLKKLDPNFDPSKYDDVLEAMTE
jgi:hypothetical protein